MKLTINQNRAIGETEIILNCTEMDARIRSLVDYIRQYSVTLPGEIDGTVYYVPLETVIYIDSVDKRTFFYDRHRIFRSRSTLTELEMRLENTHFARISKNCIVNLALIQCVCSCGNHKSELTMTNGEHLMVGRTYQKVLQKKLDAFHDEKHTLQSPVLTGEKVSEPLYAAERCVLNGGKVLCFPDIPRRVAVLSYGAAELLCALGLRDQLAAIAPAEDSLEHVLPQYRKMLETVPVLKNHGDGIPTVQELRAMEIDLALCPWYYPQMLVPDARNALGFQMYIAESTVPEKAVMEQLYRDILNLGRIFRVEDRAIGLVEQSRRRIAVLARRITRRRPVRVFVYDGGENEPLTALRGTLENDLIALAGGVNVFGNVDGSYHAVSWQKAAEAEPEAIVVHDYPDSMSLAEKLAYLKQRPELSQTPAVQLERFVPLALLEIFPGIQNANAIDKMIRVFHPDAL